MAGGCGALYVDVGQSSIANAVAVRRMDALAHGLGLLDGEWWTNMVAEVLAAGVSAVPTAVL